MTYARTFFAAAALSASLVLAVACSDDHTDGHDAGGAHQTPYASCNAITGACHALDVGDGPIHDCHELAHAATNDETCAAQKDRCLAICVADAGAAGDGG